MVNGEDTQEKRLLMLLILVLEGLILAVCDIDEVIRIIRASRTREDAIAGLMARHFAIAAGHRHEAHRTLQGQGPEGDGEQGEDGSGEAAAWSWSGHKGHELYDVRRAERTRGTSGHERYGIKYSQHAAARDILRYSRYLVVERKERVRASVVERRRARRYRCLLAQSPRRRVRYAFWRAAFGHGFAVLCGAEAAARLSRQEISSGCFSVGKQYHGK